MRLTVLGCNGPYPAANGACSGYLLQDEGALVLVDCGCGVLPRLCALLEPALLDCVMLSHLHYDHMSDMLPLLYRCAALGKRLTVYLPPQDAPVRALLDNPAFELRDLSLGARVGALAVTALPVRHPAPCYALRFEGVRGEAFCYTGDTNTCAPLVGFARGCDLLLADACFPDALWDSRKPHLSARGAGELAAAAGAKGLLLTHFRPDIDTETLLRQAREVFPTARAAHPGLSEEI